jgi:hypothetical protein
MKAKQSRTRHGKEFVEYTCKPDKAGGRCPSPAAVKATVIEPFVTERLFDFAEGAAGEATEEHGDEQRIIDAIATERAELDAALDGRLAEALGGANSQAFLRTIERRSANLESLDEKLGEIQSQRTPIGLDANLAEVWDDLNVEQRRRVLHSVFDSVFVWRTPERGRNGKFPIAERTRFFLAGEGPPVPRRGQRGTIRTLPLKS